jgi:hypothetical protein
MAKKWTLSLNAEQNCVYRYAPNRAGEAGDGALIESMYAMSVP